MPHPLQMPKTTKEIKAEAKKGNSESTSAEERNREKKDEDIVWFGLLAFYVTCNDNSVIYLTAQMCRRIGEVVPTVGLQTP